MTKAELIIKIIDDTLGIDYPGSEIMDALSRAYEAGYNSAALANPGTPAVQDQPTQKGLLSELIGIREGMATKADLLKLEEGLTGIIIKLADRFERSATRPDSTASADWDPLRFDLLLQRIDCLENGTVASLTERVDRLANWYHELVCGLKDHGSRIQDLERSATRPEYQSTLQAVLDLDKRIIELEWGRFCRMREKYEKDRAALPETSEPKRQDGPTPKDS